MLSLSFLLRVALLFVCFLPTLPFAKQGGLKFNFIIKSFMLLCSNLMRYISTTSVNSLLYSRCDS